MSIHEIIHSKLAPPTLPWPKQGHKLVFCFLTIDHMYPHLIVARLSSGNFKLTTGLSKLESHKSPYSAPFSNLSLHVLGLEQKLFTFRLSRLKPLCRRWWCSWLIDSAPEYFSGYFCIQGRGARNLHVHCKLVEAAKLLKGFGGKLNVLHLVLIHRSPECKLSLRAASVRASKEGSQVLRLRIAAACRASPCLTIPLCPY